MHNSLRSTEHRKPTPSPVNGGYEKTRRAVHPRFDVVAIGFWLGAVSLGIAGCTLGVFMSSSHPVGRVVSMIWWGLYGGSFGASIGALVGLFIQPTSPAGKRGKGKSVPPNPATRGGTLFRHKSPPPLPLRPSD
jgi:hypothetical protein